MNLKKIAERIRKVAKFEGYVYDDKTTINIQVPSFTVKAKIRFYKTKNQEIIKQPVNIEIDTLDNNIDEVLNKVVPPAIIKAVNGKIPDKLSDKDFYIGGWTSGFPKSVHFNVA
jgi:hypothetical protein